MNIIFCKGLDASKAHLTQKEEHEFREIMRCAQKRLKEELIRIKLPSNEKDFLMTRGPRMNKIQIHPGFISLYRHTMNQRPSILAQLHEDLGGLEDEVLTELYVTLIKNEPKGAQMISLTTALIVLAICSEVYREETLNKVC